LLVSPHFGALDLDFLVLGDMLPCPYISGQDSRSEVFLAEQLPPELYHDFMDHGFRRSGILLYRPSCPECAECRPIRVPVGEFEPSKSQRRVLRANHDVSMSVALPRFTEEKYKIYTQYLRVQHESRQGCTPEEFKRFLYDSPVNTVEFEYRLSGRLVAVTIADLCSRSLSSVYAYYDIEFSMRSLGTFSALQEILFCMSRGTPYYYLGFYVATCPAMNYKARFKPHEILSDDLQWVRSGVESGGVPTDFAPLD
jgi:leucyl-tRNA---protein transferase